MKAKNLLKLSLLLAVLCALLAITTMADDDYKLIAFDGVSDNVNMEMPYPGGTNDRTEIFFDESIGYFVNRLTANSGDVSEGRYFLGNTIDTSTYPYMKVMFKNNDQDAGTVNFYLATGAANENGFEFTGTSNTAYTTKVINVATTLGKTPNIKTVFIKQPGATQTAKTIDIVYIAFFKTETEANAFNGPQQYEADDEYFVNFNFAEFATKFEKATGAPYTTEYNGDTASATYNIKGQYNTSNAGSDRWVVVTVPYIEEEAENAPPKVIAFDGAEDNVSINLPSGTSTGTTSLIVNEGKFISRHVKAVDELYSGMTFTLNEAVSATEYPFYQIKYSTSNGDPIQIFINGTNVYDLLSQSTVTNNIKNFNINSANLQGGATTPTSYNSFYFRIRDDGEKTNISFDIEYIAFFKNEEDMNAYAGPASVSGSFNEDTFSLTDYANSYADGASATISDVTIAGGNLTGTITSGTKAITVTVPYVEQYASKIIAFDGNAGNVKINIPQSANANGKLNLVNNDGKFVAKIDRTVTSSSAETLFALSLANEAKFALNDYRFVKVKYNTDFNGPINFRINNYGYCVGLKALEATIGGEKKFELFFDGDPLHGCDASFWRENALDLNSNTVDLSSIQFHLVSHDSVSESNLMDGSLEIEYIAFFHTYDQMIAYNGPEAAETPYNEATFSIDKYVKTYANGEDAAIPSMVIGEDTATATIGAYGTSITVTIPFEANDYGMVVENLGAQIRVDAVTDEAISANALRFGTKLNYDTENEALEDVVYGAIIGTPGSEPKKEYEGTKPLNFHNAGNFEAKEDGIYFNTVVTGIPVGQIGTQVQVTPFITYTVNGGNYTRYFAPITRSVQDVLDALAENAETEWDVD